MSDTEVDGSLVDVNWAGLAIEVVLFSSEPTDLLFVLLHPSHSQLSFIPRESVTGSSSDPAVGSRADYSSTEAEDLSNVY